MTNILKYFKKQNKQKLSAEENRNHIFAQMPIWKSVLKMSIPGVIQMLFFGAYMFADSVIAVNFANDNYNGVSKEMGISSHDLVRMFMAGASPVAAFIGAITMLFAVGTATRVSINLGKGDIAKAKRTLRSGVMTSTIMSFVLMPVLYFAAIPWMESQYDPIVAHTMADHAFAFAQVAIFSFPIQAFAQTMQNLFIVEGRNKEMVTSSITTVIVNIILDFILLIPGQMGIEGAALATLIGNVFGGAVAIYYIIKIKSDVLTFKNMYGKFSWLPLVGIILVGLAPFIRQLAQATTATAEAHIISSVSKVVYSDLGPKQAALKMTDLFAGTMPIFTLVFPTAFAFATSAGPIAAFNYGAGNMQRVKGTIKWTMIYATVVGTIFYFVVAFAIGGPLLDALGATGDTKTQSLVSVKIVMITLPVFSLAITGMALFSSTDRVLFNILSAALWGFIFLFPALYAFKAIAIAVPSYKYAFWWFYPVLGTMVSIASIFMVYVTIKKLDFKQTTLDERIERINLLFEHKKALRLAIKEVKNNTKESKKISSEINSLKLKSKNEFSAIRNEWKKLKIAAREEFKKTLLHNKEVKNVSNTKRS